jgi:hypothetical protein
MAGRTRCWLWRRRLRTSVASWAAVFCGCTHGFAGGMKVLALLAVLLTVSTATGTERSGDGGPATTTSRLQNSSSSPTAPTRPPVTRTLLPPPPTPSHSTSEFLRPRRSANPWTVVFGEFGDCTFSGDYDGAPLVRTGSCPTADGALSLQSKGITSVPASVFSGLTSLRSHV